MLRLPSLHTSFCHPQAKTAANKPAASTAGAKPNQAAPKAATRNLLNAPKTIDQQKKQVKPVASTAGAKPNQAAPKAATRNLLTSIKITKGTTPAAPQVCRLWAEFGMG
jgi:hypothetical protein